MAAAEGGAAAGEGARPSRAAGESAPAAQRPAIAVRPATPADLPRVSELFGALHAYNATFDKAFELSDAWPTYLAEAFTRAVDQPDALWILAWDGDEAVGLLRRLWTEDHVTHQGRYYHLSDVTIAPKPVQSCPPIWFGGRSEPAYRRTGRLGDGWLASFITPAEVQHGIAAIQSAASESGRSIDPDHYGAIISFRIAGSAEAAQAGLQTGLLRRRPDVPLEEYCALGTPDDCVAMIRRYVDAGASKFVLRPACDPQDLDAQIEILAREVVPAVEAIRV